MWLGVALAAVLLAGAAHFAAAGSSKTTTDTMPVKILTQGPNLMVVVWKPPANAQGFIFRVDGHQVSRTRQPLRSEVLFRKLPGQHTYQVEAVTDATSGQLTETK